MSERTTCGHARAARRRASAFVLVFLATVAAVVLGVLPAGAATSNVTVSMSVPSTIALGNSCTTPASYQIGSVLPNTAGLTSTATPCTMTFQSSNDTAMLRAVQGDRWGGTAMAQSDVSWSTLINLYHPDITAASVVPGTASTAFFTGRAGRVWRTTNSGGTLTLAGSVPAAPNDMFAVEAPSTSVVFAAGNGRSLWKSSNANTTLDFADTCTTGCLAVPAASNFISITSQDASHVWAGTNTGQIIGTADGGTTWSAPLTPVGGANINSLVDVPGTDDIYGATTNGRVLKSINGGGGWNVLNAGSTGKTLKSITVVRVATTDYVYASTSDGKLLKGTIGDTVVASAGGAWALVDVHPKAHGRLLSSIVATDQDTVYVGGENGRIYKSVDASTAATFTPLAGGSGGSVMGLDALPGSATLYSAQGGANLVASTNGGTTLTVTVPLGDNHRFSSNDIATGTAQQAYVAIGHDSSGGTLARTTNAGAAWSTISSGEVTDSMLGISLATNDAGTVNGVAVGQDGVTSSTTDAWAAVPTWTYHNIGQQLDLRDVSLAPHGLVAFAVGEGGAIWRSDDGGSTWTAQVSGTTSLLDSVVAISEAVAYASGEGGTLLRTVNGGASWQAVPGAPAGDLWSLAMPSPNVLLVGQNVGLVSRSLNADAPAVGSITFSTINLAANSSVRAVAAASQDAFIAVTDSGSVRYSLDGGATFGSYNATSRQLYSVAMPEYHTSWIGGEGGRLYRQAPLATIGDYGGGNLWGSASTTSMFGACLQAKGATTIADWAVDAANAPGQCEALDTDPWQAIPTSPSKVAHTASGAAGSVSMVFGIRPAASQVPATYTSTVVFEALSPDV